MNLWQARTVFPLDLTNPETIPTQNLQDPVVFPPSDLTNSPTVISPFTNLSTPASIQLRQNAFNEITQILNNTEKTFNTTCQQCMASLLVLQNLTRAVPWEVPPILIQICNFVHFDGIFRNLYCLEESLNLVFKAFGSCEQEFMANSDGQISTQLLANADVAGQDGEASILFVKNSPLT